MRNAKKMQNEISKIKMEKVKAKKGDEVLLPNSLQEKSAIFLKKDQKIALNPGHYTTF